MRFLLAGAWEHVIYESSVAEALRRSGVEVIPFSWGADLSRIPVRIGMKLGVDVPFARKAHQRLVIKIQQTKPDVVMLWRPVFFGAESVKLLREAYPNAFLICYNNDNPFRDGGAVNGRFWKPFCEAIPQYDLNLVYRPENLSDFASAGSRATALWRAAYMDETFMPSPLAAVDEERYACDVVFAGHYERDGRADALLALANSGVKVRLYGDSAWPGQIVRRISPVSWPIVRPSGHEYSKALRGAKIALVFLSRHNTDSYTRRNFEIPACGVCMVSERTDDLMTLFRENEEAIFFSDGEELVVKIKQLLGDDHRREQIARRGYERVVRDGHGVFARSQELLRLIAENGGPRHNGGLPCAV